MATSVTEAQVVEYLGLDPLTGSDATVMTEAVAAVNVLVPGTVPRVRALTAGTDWPDDVILGAIMQAARLFTRRRSPTGIATYTETGPAYTPRWDPDIERLMQFGKWEKPGFG